MTDYKLVPVEPTPGMLEAGKYALDAGCHASGIYADMLAAAPYVQGEPVGEIGSINNCPVAYWDKSLPVGTKLYTAPQPAERPPAAKFKHGDLVRKIKGSQWKGRVVGTYSTELTPEGYAVESDTEKGSVQIYPAAALEMVTDDEQRSPAAPDDALTIADYEEVLAGHRCLTRELDVLLNGEEGAAQQASLCDLVAQLRTVVKDTGKPILAAPDVAGLVEALEKALHLLYQAVNLHQLDTGLVEQTVNTRAELRTLVAAHRKQQEGEA